MFSMIVIDLENKSQLDSPHNTDHSLESNKGPLDKYTKYEISEALRPDLSFGMVLTLAMGGRLFRNVNCVISGVALRFVGGRGEGLRFAAVQLC